METVAVIDAMHDGMNNIITGVTKILRFQVLDSSLKGALSKDSQGQCSYFYMLLPFIAIDITLSKWRIILIWNQPEPNMVAMMVETVCFSNMLRKAYHTAWCKNSKDCNLLWTPENVHYLTCVFFT
jgi:hypothetical protein